MPTSGTERARRWFDMAASLAGLVFLAPILASVSVALLLLQGRPILFRQVRVGMNGRRFRILKFRTMSNQQPTGSQRVTAAGDQRITSAGRWLRRFKWDEFPQLFNVLRGEMSLVGPRPEVPEFVDPDDPVWQRVLQARPGITDCATLLFRDEEKLLAASADPIEYYRDSVLPSKLDLNLRYQQTRSLQSDLELILFTLWYGLLPVHLNATLVRSRLLGESPCKTSHSQSLFTTPPSEMPK